MALSFSTQMAILTGNTGGAIQQLLTPSDAGGRKRSFRANIVLAAQASGSQIAVARLPINAAIFGINYLTDTSLATATIALGDIHAGNSAIYAAATTLTAVQTPTSVGLVATRGAPITAGYDCLTGNQLGWEDVVLTTGVAALPASGNLVIEFDYVID
ncbi:MAG TPA: hypothetical protein VGV37_02505 [Aliidongia sp.]|uniref:hypothetical protein n=1 Tax=Aliidongia sp. TaxID=1914230 RepID=UPI002DDD7901|nr:hypothetical protein [Aliidongia sp.]HEV2673382.1 hypothetical protein [Aliidongia sp.]